MSVSVVHALILGALLFILGGIGMVLNRRHILVFMMSLELMFLAVSFSLAALMRHVPTVQAEIFIFIILALAAAEAAVGLAVFLVYFRTWGRATLGTLEGGPPC